MDESVWTLRSAKRADVNRCEKYEKSRNLQNLSPDFGLVILQPGLSLFLDPSAGSGNGRRSALNLYLFQENLGKTGFIG